VVIDSIGNIKVGDALSDIFKEIGKTFASFEQSPYLYTTNKQCVMDKSIDQIMMTGSNQSFSLSVNSLFVDDRPIAIEDVYDCLRQNFPINRLELVRMERLV